jgi:hypothetical protein
MEIIEVPDIMVAKGGVFRSLRDGAAAKDGFKPVVPGSGVFKGGDWYVLKNNYVLSLTAYVINTAAGGGNYSLGIGSIGGGWSVQSKPSWVTLYKQNTIPLLSEEINEGMEGATIFTANVAANTNTSMRNGTVVFVHAEESTVTASLAITQAAAASIPEPEPALKSITLSFYSKDITAGHARDNNEYLLSVMSVGGGWSMQSKPDWVYLSQNNGNGSGTYGDSIAVTVLANNSTSARSGAVVFQHALDNSITATLQITQAAGASIPEPEPEPLLPIVVEVTPVYDGQGYGLQARATVRDGVAPVPLSANFRLHAATSGNSGVWKNFSVTIDSGQSTMLSNWVNVGTLFGFVNDGELVSQDPATYLDREIIWEIYHEGR